MNGDQSAKHISILLLFIICIGVCGNILSLIVFSKSNMRKISIFRFLFYLSIADLLVLLICSTETLLKFGFHIEIRLTSPFTCSFHTFITNLLTHLSSIILMVISVERASVICNKKIWSIFKRKSANGTNPKATDESKEKISLKELESAEITTATATTTTTFDNNTTMARFSFNFRERFQNLKRYGLFKFLFNNNNNDRFSFISKINRIEMIMILIVIALIIINSHYLFFMKLNQSTIVERKTTVLPNSTRPCKFCSLNNNANKSKNIISNSIIKSNNKQTNNMTRFFNIKPQDKIKEQIKNQFNSKKTQIRRHYICYPMNGTSYNYFLNHIWIWVDLCFYSLIPFAVMSTCSIIILVEINRKSKKYLSYLEKETSKSNRIKADKRLRRNKQLLFMLTSTNLFFILFSLLPYCVSFFKFKGEISEANLGQSFVAILSYINNAFNFLLYGITSQKYREESAKIMFPFKTFNRQNNQSSKLRPKDNNTKEIGQKLNIDNKINPANPNVKKSCLLKEDSKLLSEAPKSTITTSLKSLKFDFQPDQFKF